MTFSLPKYRAQRGDKWRNGRACDEWSIEWVHVPDDGTLPSLQDVKVNGSRPNAGDKMPGRFNKARAFEAAYPDYWIEVSRNGKVIKPMHSETGVIG